VRRRLSASTSFVRWGAETSSLLVRVSTLTPPTRRRGMAPVPGAWGFLAGTGGVASRVRAREVAGPKSLS
jgi:hypothetical protein